MNPTSTLLALIAAAALAGCNEDHTIVAGPPGGETTTTANSQVTLPPAISASKIYRCAGNGLIYIDWLSDGKSANIRTEKNGPPTQVTAPEPGQPMRAAGGYALTGAADAPSIKVTVPGQAEKSCKA